MKLNEFLTERTRISISVYENDKYSIAHIEQRGSGYYAEIDDQGDEWDKSFPNKSALNKWLKSNKYEKVGEDHRYV